MNRKPDDLTPPALGGELARGEVAGCPTGLSDLEPVHPAEPEPPPAEPPAFPQLEVERLRERDEEIKVDDDEP